MNNPTPFNLAAQFSSFQRKKTAPSHNPFQAFNTALQKSVHTHTQPSKSPRLFARALGTLPVFLPPFFFCLSCFPSARAKAHNKMKQEFVRFFTSQMNSDPAPTASAAAAATTEASALSSKKAAITLQMDNPLQKSTDAVNVAIIANLFCVIAKLFAFLYTGSSCRPSLASLCPSSDTNS